ncbi:MAG: TRAP transporter permease [Spirochaetia bacterium]|jgi:TRAP transporter 4TM/12TM fusion protein|nr:TRAP transporter permease [Spirochaetia bacterium]
MDKSYAEYTLVDCLILAVSAFICFFHIFITVSTSVSMMQCRIIHVFSLALVWYLFKLRDTKAKWQKAVLFLILCIIAFATFYYMKGAAPDAIREKGVWGISQFDVAMGVLLILMVLEISRETIGLALPILAVIFIIYAFVGPYLPEIVAHRGYDIPYISNYISWTTEGIFGIPIGASVSFVVLYIIFGELLDKFGAGKFFIDIAYALTGRMRGGPAEASVLSSAMMGSINGSAVANVVTTGTFTIPLMKKIGYSNEYAGAVEAVASTGGQILPPVMGVAAFVMADLTGIPYSTIILAALIPGLLYYISLGLAVYLEAGKLGMQPESAEKLKKARVILRQGYYYLIPIIILICCLLALKLSASYSGFFAILSILAIGITKTSVVEHRFPWKEFKAVALGAARSAVPVAMACASAGIVIGIVSMTGLGVRFAEIVFEVSHGNLFLMLLMTMVACIILGMGLPSTAAYVIAATVAAPALLKAGIPDLATNLFVFYFAIISFITPPVAISAYAASGIANSDAMRTGLQAFKLGIAGFIIPYLFVFYPGLLIVDATVTGVLLAITIAVLSVILMAIGFEGWFGKTVPMSLRVVALCLGVLLLVPSTVLHVITVSFAVVLVIFLVSRSKKQM